MKRSPWRLVGMMLCESIGCPHIDLLEEYGVTWDRLVDWHAYYLWKFRDSNEDDDNAKDKLKKLKEQDALLGL